MNLTLLRLLSEALKGVLTSLNIIANKAPLDVIAMQDVKNITGVFSLQSQT